LGKHVAYVKTVLNFAATNLILLAEGLKTAGKSPILQEGYEENFRLFKVCWLAFETARPLLALSLGAFNGIFTKNIDQ
jgi:hypothetical protein